MSSREKRAAKKEKKLSRMTAEQDIRYRGPLSYRAFKLLGWACIVLSQVVVLLTLESKLDPTMTDILVRPIATCSALSSLALPFLLIANFALILNHSEGYASQIRKYTILVVIVLAVSVLLYSRYIVGTAAILTEDRAAAKALITEAFWNSSREGYLSYNLFIDLLLCTLLMFFLNYRPKKVFVGNKLWIFRAFAALPILYEAASIVLKMLASAKTIRLPMLIFPFLTVKPPITFLVFIVLAVFIKRRELRFRRGGKTHEEYLAFLETNRNSWDFSVFTAVVLAVAGIVDFIAAIVFVLTQTGLVVDTAALDVASMLERASAFNLGESFPLLLLAPIMLLFSYTRTHKNKTIDVLIPGIGVSGIVIAYLEGLYQFFLMLPDMLGPYADSLMTEYGPIIAALMELE
jgi:hypothetical protein